MRLHVIVAKEKTGDPWVVGAWDEFSIDENSEGFERELAEHKKKHHEVRVAVVVVVQDFLHLVFGSADFRGSLIKVQSVERA